MPYCEKICENPEYCQSNTQYCDKLIPFCEHYDHLYEYKKNDPFKEGVDLTWIVGNKNKIQK